MPQSPPPPGAQVGTRAWQGSGACRRRLCPELCLSSFPVRAHQHPAVMEIDPDESGLCSWPCAEPGVENLEHFTLRNLGGRRHHQNIVHINDVQSGCLCHLLIVTGKTAAMC